MFWILNVFILPTVINAIGQPHYECGEHGRFEYCIDGIPGCIVGCHCHPGYYFDTETKICEPNAKLVQEYRRLYNVPAPTRLPEIILPYNALDVEPTPTTPNSIDVQVVENLAKDNDDLGDWLYNQFFKTIENQVINNTDTTTDKPTRRSGDPEMKKMRPLMRENKKSKNFMKRSKKKKSDLRRKLLRITEDDSLFDSSSGSDEESSDSESESDDSSDTSSDREDGGGGGGGKTPNNNAHGHRKILMINKKPKPPLPSFIFLPQMDTPFFPPIGLPAPALPMYPMVPVPPMPMYPYPGFQSTTCSKSATTTAATTKSTNSDNPTNSDDKKQPENPDTENKKNGTESSPNMEAENGDNTQKPDPSKDDKTKLRTFRSGKRQRNKLLQQLQDQMKNSNMPALMKKIKRKMRKNAGLEELDEFDNPFMDDFLNQPHVSPDEPPLEDVDFKYLTQLIHKMDNSSDHRKQNMMPNNIQLFMPPGPQNMPPNMPRNLLPNMPSNMPPNMPPNLLPNMPSNMLPNMPPNMQELFSSMNPNMLPKSDMQSRRNGDYNSGYSIPHLSSTQNERHKYSRRNLASLNNSYYSNLGQQIANLIRKMDTTDDRRLDTVSQQNVPPPQTFFSENSIGPKSFWERSVRSLLKYYHPYTNDNDMPTLRQDSLFNLEKRVEIIATTVHPLSLNELENFVFLIDKTKSELQTSTTEVPDIKLNGMDNSLNINLLPRQYDKKNYDQKNLHQSYVEPLTELLTQKLKNDSEIIKQFTIANKVQDNKQIANSRINTGNREKNIRKALLKNFKSIKSDLKKVNTYSVSNIPNVKIEQISNADFIYKSRPTLDINHNNIQNVTTRPQYNNELPNLNRMAGVKFNEAVNARNHLPHIPWLSNILRHNHVHRLDNKASMADSRASPVNIGYNSNIGTHKHTPRFPSLGFNNNKYFKNNKILPLELPMLAVHSVRSESAPSYFHQHHFDLLDE